MSSPIISIKDLGKEYIIGGRERGPDTFREMLMSSLAVPFRRLRQLGGAFTVEEERFWALKDVSFDVKEGEVVGIIGRNGAGKSTLLKILSRIAEPSEGRITIRGRVASLLEVGTGFHPELTGRENIYLNGAILGMSRAEIRYKFDEIVAFAEIEKFLDTPVKRYSSGMYVRLAFAVAAHLDPEILIIDEVLAVGDLEFQEKCLKKMESTSRCGRTVLFVSHNMHAVARLCSRAVGLKKGSVFFDGNVNECLKQYTPSACKKTDGNVISFKDRSAPFFIDRVELLDRFEKPVSEIRTWDELIFRIVFHASRPVGDASVELLIASMSGTVLFRGSTTPDSAFPLALSVGENRVDCHVRKLSLSAGQYIIGAALARPNVEWLCHNLDGGIIEVLPKDIFASGFPPQSSRYLVPMEHTWRVSSKVEV